MELLSLIKFSLLIRHHFIKKIQNTENPSNKALKKITWLKKFKKNPQLKEGNKIYLLIKNFRSKKPSKKFNYIKIGPFLVDKQKDIPKG